MAGDTSTDRFEGAKKLLDYGFANYSFSKIAPELKEKEIELSKGESKTVKVKSDENISLLMLKSTKNNISREVEWVKNLTAPVKKGQTVGYVNIYNGEENIGRIPIIASENVEKRSFWLSFTNIFKNMFTI